MKDYNAVEENEGLDFLTEKAIRGNDGKTVRVDGRFGKPDAVDYKNNVIWELKPWEEGGRDQVSTISFASVD